jgi:hypothetical protein
MALVFRDRVGDTVATVPGTGTLTLTGLAVTGFRPFIAAAFPTGSTVRYCAISADFLEWEVGEGIWTVTGMTLTRAKVFASSNGGTLVAFTKVLNVYNVGTAADAQETLVYAQLTLPCTLSSTNLTYIHPVIPFDSIVTDLAAIWDYANFRVVPKTLGYYRAVLNIECNTAALPLGVGMSQGGSPYHAGTPSVLYYNHSCMSPVSTYGIDRYAGNSVAVLYCNGTTDFIQPVMFLDNSLLSATLNNSGGRCNFAVYGPL